jgi:spermidine/putrescine transport system ATP-binding protein
MIHPGALVLSAQLQKAAIDIRNTSKIYGKSREDGVVALDDVSLLIRDNEFFTLLGPSGCGKTTLLRLIAGFEQPTQGEILLFDNHLEGLPPYKRPVNTVFQHYALFPHMTVTDNIAFGLEMLGKPEAEIKATVKEVLALVQMEHLANRKTSEISGGQQQRVALARALAPRPKVLLLDEPLSALDFKLRKEMQLELKRLQLDTGITFVFVTHDQEEALTMSDRVAVMNAGNILQVGSPKDIYDHPARRFVADFIGDINILGAEILSSDQGRAKIRLPSGFETSASLPEHSEALSGNVSIAVRPEQLEFIDDKDSAALVCTIKRITYFGSGSHYDLETSTGESVTLRQQNRLGDNRSFDVGDQVNIAINEGSLQVLSD